MYMSVWVAEALVRRAQRLSARRSLCHHVRLTSLQSPGQQCAHTWRPRPRETYVRGSLVRPVRFFSSSVNQEEKDLVPSSSPPGDVRDDQPLSRRFFNDELQRCGSPSDVLDFMCRYATTAKQTSSCLNRMWITTKLMSDEQQRLEQRLMFEHEALDKLLNAATNSVAYMPNEDLTYSLLAMLSLGIPHQSRVVQTFVRVCQVRQQRGLQHSHPSGAQIVHLFCYVCVCIFFLNLHTSLCCTNIDFLLHRSAA